MHTLHDLERTGSAGQCGFGKGISDLQEGILGFSLIICTGIEHTVKGENVGCHVDEERIRFLGFDIDGVVIYYYRIGKRLKKSLEVRTHTKTVHRKNNIFCGKRIPAVKFYTLSQIKTNRQWICTFIFMRQTRFKRHILSIPYQWIKYPVGELQHPAGKLFLNIHGLWIRIKSKSQRFCTRNGTK